MAGEWIPIDCNLGTKPEVLELVDDTGVPVEAVVYRLIQLWSWAAMNTADGTLRATPARLQAVAGGDEAFWLAVERVGWVTFLNGTVVIEGWEKRFSRAAKARLQDARRKASERSVRTLSEKCPKKIGLQDSTGEKNTYIPAAPVATTETRKPRSRSQPTDSIRWTPAAGWEGITAEDRAAWAAAYPACDVARELAAAGEWLRANPEKARKSRWRSFLVRWLSRSQDRGGGKPSNRPGAPPPAKAWAERPSWRDDACRNLTDAQYREWLKTQKRSQEPQGAVRGVAVPPADSVDPF